MLRKAFVVGLVLCFHLTFLLGQTEKTILSAPKDWSSEMIPFPLPFAKDIDFEGVEDIRFAPNWDDPEHLNFWTYTFVWNIDMIGMSSAEKLDELFALYYNGLMPAVLEQNEETDLLEEVGEAIVKFEEVEEGVFQGSVEVFDAFFTKKRQTLYVKVSEFFCPDTDRQLIRSDISLLYFGAPIWDEFEKVTITANCEK